MFVLALLLLFSFHVYLGLSWNLMNHSTTWIDGGGSQTQLEGQQQSWYNIWGWPYPKNSGDFHVPPRPRVGHSLLKAVVQNSGGAPPDIYIVIFGGRDNDNITLHIPKTYNVKIVGGLISFTTYTEKPVQPCFDYDLKFWSKEDQKNCDKQSANIPVGVIYNDVWAYKITGNKNVPAQVGCNRYFDGPCENMGWVLWHTGALQGGCLIQLGIEVCNVPSERYNHGAALFSDGCLYVYGGFSQRCEDYCDDIWFFDIYLKSWRQIYSANDLSHYYQTINLKIVPFPNVPISNGSSPGPWAGPGPRWRFSMKTSGLRIPESAFPYSVTSAGVGMQTTSLNCPCEMMAIFGGHRLWHGFSSENSQSNNWNLNTSRIPGGYLNDLWIYIKEIDITTRNGQTFHTSNGAWQLMQPVYVCLNSWDRVSWDARFDVACTFTWPNQRAGHGMVIDTKRNLIWIYGGYATYYPYIRTDGSGSGPGVAAVGSGGFIPYPDTYTFYMGDLWTFNLTSGKWTEIVPISTKNPDGRSDMVFELLNDEILMHGGAANNYIYDDMWYYNITSNEWLEKKTFVYPKYPSSCTDDIKTRDPECTQLLWPYHIERNSTVGANFKIKPYTHQPYYWPDQRYGPYYSIQRIGTSSSYKLLPISKKLKPNDFAPYGTPMVPYAATGPMQWVKRFIYQFNSTFNGTVYEYCTSVYAEPTRGTVLDGRAGRSKVPIQIAVPRTQAPGWDGCRNSETGEAGLRYYKPTSRYGHSAVYIAEFNEFYVYGGMAYDQERRPSLNFSWPARVVDELWYINFDYCIKNCSSHGTCYFGFCFCNVGYWGEDCSNSSCPGTSCYYDKVSHEQICVHACQAGYNHTDADVYQQDIAKLPCTQNLPGESNGICDGYGHSMCAPPYVGEDCSIKDCKDNCTFNGWCSLEYPVARCLCNPGYFGNVCQYMQCLNNCSYPNGVCNTTSGSCNCRMMYSPYNNTRLYHPWAGEDCSFILPYAAAAKSYRFSLQENFILLFLCIIALYSADFISVISSTTNTNVLYPIRECERKFRPG